MQTVLLEAFTKVWSKHLNGKKPLQKPLHRLKYNIKKDILEVGCRIVVWIKLAGDKVQVMANAEKSYFFLRKADTSKPTELLKNVFPVWSRILIRGVQGTLQKRSSVTSRGKLATLFNYVRL